MSSKKPDQIKDITDFEALFDKSAGERKATVEFKELSLTLRYLSQAALQEMAKECTVHRFHPVSKARETHLNAKKFNVYFCEKVVVNWEGMTVNVLARMMPVRLEAVPLELRDNPIPYSPKQMATLMENCTDLSVFLSNTCTDISVFQSETHEGELGNSEATQNGN